MNIGWVWERENLNSTEDITQNTKDHTMYFGFFKNVQLLKKWEANVPQLFEEVKKELDLVLSPTTLFRSPEIFYECEAEINEHEAEIMNRSSGLFFFSKFFLLFGLKFRKWRSYILCIGFVILIRFLLLSKWRCKIQCLLTLRWRVLPSKVIFLKLKKKINKSSKKKNL